jgi:alanine racemase
MSHGITQRPTEAVIDLNALAFNFHSTRSLVGTDVKYMAVVKADAYGHGAIECARRLEADGIDWFGVAIPEEGVEIRKAGVKTPILCLGSFWPGQEELLFEYGLTTVIYDIERARHLSRFAADKGTVDIHVKIDTGMHRVGVDFSEADAFANELKTFTNLRVNGLLTHFSSAENPREDDFTALQIQRFKEACEIFRKAGHDPEWLDMANSPAAIAHADSRGNMVRLGGALYGLLDDIMPEKTPLPELKPVLSLRSQIAYVRHVPAGETLGYGRIYRTDRDSRIALLPIGYADGYPRGLSNRGKAWVNGHLVPVVGRISMDWTFLDVTDAGNVQIGDEVYIIGGLNAAVRAADLARELDTIGYEITCGISPRVCRRYIGGEASAR